MSWGAPGVAAAPYQPPPFSNGASAYTPQQPPQNVPLPYQPAPGYPASGPLQRPSDNRPPKKKGNPIITRYPPPPGYRGPAQPQAPYGQPQYPNQYPHAQSAQPPYAPGYHAPSNYPSQGFSATPAYPPTPTYTPTGYGPPQGYPPQPGHPQQPYPAPQTYPYAQQGVQQATGYPQTPGYAAAPGYTAPPATYQGYPPQSAPIDPSQQVPQHYSQSHVWQQHSVQPQYSANGPYSQQGVPGPDPNATPTPTSAHPAPTENTTPGAAQGSTSNENGGKPPLYLAWDDWDFDFEGAIWPKSNEPVDKNLSLGVIIWHPARQATRALPSTFEEAEKQAMQPPAEKLGNGESVSMYFTLENSHEAFLDVRQTDEWDKIKDDPAFVVFPDDKDMDLIPLEECIANRDRPDVPLEDPNRVDDEDMQDSWNVMDNLEQALSGDAETTKSSKSTDNRGFKKDQTQEEILAMLGVTGSPKPPSNEVVEVPSLQSGVKPAANLPEKPPVPPPSQPHSRHEQPPQRANSYGGHHNRSHAPAVQRPYGSLSTSGHIPPPPPPQAVPEYDPENPVNSKIFPKGRIIRHSPAPSEGSNHTLAGSDFDRDEKPVIAAEKSDGSAAVGTSGSMPQLQRGDNAVSRKRSYEATAEADEKTRQHDDQAKRKRRSQVASAYSRR